MNFENSDNSNQSLEENSVLIDVTEESPITSEKNTEDSVIQSSAKAPKFRNTRLPIARVRHIMKTDPECQLISADAALIVTKATELFLGNFASLMVKYTLQNKRKTILKRDFDATIESNPKLCFLDGTID